MKLSQASVYALHALAHIAGQKHDRPIASHHIAQAQGIPDRFLLKVLKPLASAEPPILFSTKGPHGGYRLARPAAEITVLEVVEAVEGPIRGGVPMPPSRSGNGRKPLDTALHKRVEAAWKGTADVLREQLGKIPLSDFVGKKK